MQLTAVKQGKPRIRINKIYLAGNTLPAVDYYLCSSRAVSIVHSQREQPLHVLLCPYYCPESGLGCAELINQFFTATGRLSEPPEELQGGDGKKSWERRLLLYNGTCCREEEKEEEVGEKKERTGHLQVIMLMIEFKMQINSLVLKRERNPVLKGHGILSKLSTYSLQSLSQLVGEDGLIKLCTKLSHLLVNLRPLPSYFENLLHFANSIISIALVYDIRLKEES